MHARGVVSAEPELQQPSGEQGPSYERVIPAAEAIEGGQCGLQAALEVFDDGPDPRDRQLHCALQRRIVDAAGEALSSVTSASATWSSPTSTAVTTEINDSSARARSSRASVRSRSSRIHARPSGR